MHRKIVLVDFSVHNIVSESGSQVVNVVDIQRLGMGRPKPYLPSTTSLNRLKRLLFKITALRANSIKPDALFSNTGSSLIQ